MRKKVNNVGKQDYETSVYSTYSVYIQAREAENNGVGA